MASDMVITGSYRTTREHYLRRVIHHISDKMYPYDIAEQIVELADKNKNSSLNTNFDAEHIEESAELSARLTISEFYKVTPTEYITCGYTCGIKYIGSYLVAYN